MTGLVAKSTVTAAQSLLEHYGFDWGEMPAQQTCEQILERWADQYEPRWIRLAVIECLYQGRYKAVSVEQILALWLRRGQPSYRFDHEFEALICNNQPQDLSVVPPRISRPSSTIISGRAVPSAPIQSARAKPNRTVSLPSTAAKTHSSASISTAASVPPPTAPALTSSPAKPSAEPPVVPLEPTVLHHSFANDPNNHCAGGDQGAADPSSAEDTLGGDPLDFLSDSPTLDLSSPAGFALSPAGFYLPDSSQITQFQPELAPSDVYDRLRDIVRVWKTHQNQDPISQQDLT
jgi:hypothetical protein